jgi:hypothetical protein
MNPSTLARLFWWLAGGLLALGLVAGLLVRPDLCNDLAAGWQVWESMQAGAPFNCVWMPAAENLARDVPVFQSWWAPGQYLVPTLFTSAGLSFGAAVVVAGMLANALGLAGWWRLWRAWGVAPAQLVMGGLVVVCGHAWGTVIGPANLGDTLQFAAVPWAALLAWNWRRLAGPQWLGLFVVLTAGVVMKLSFQIAALAILAGAGFEAVRTNRGRDLRALAWLSVKALGLWLAVKLAWDWGYLARSASIGAAHGLQWAGWAGASLPWGGPVLAVFSVGSLVSRIALYPGNRWVADEAGLWPVFLAGAVVTIAFVGHLWRRHESRPYVMQVLAWLAVYGVVFSALYATGAAVSLETRHFHVAGLVLLPGVLWSLAQFRPPVLRFVALAGVAGCCLYGVASAGVHLRHRLRHGEVSRQGFTHTELTAGALAELRRLDGLPGGRTLFFACKAEVALEVRHGRTMCIPLDAWPETLVRKFIYEGRADRLVLVMPERYVADGKVEWIKAGLHGYREWDERKVDGFCFITGR